MSLAEVYTTVPQAGLLASFQSQASLLHMGPSYHNTVGFSEHFSWAHGKPLDYYYPSIAFLVTTLKIIFKKFAWHRCPSTPLPPAVHESSSLYTQATPAAHRHGVRVPVCGPQVSAGLGASGGSERWGRSGAQMGRGLCWSIPASCAALRRTPWDLPTWLSHWLVQICSA